MLNGDAMMYAASLPKIAILLGAFVQAERGKLVLDEPTLASLNRMIRNSAQVDRDAVDRMIGVTARMGAPRGWRREKPCRHCFEVCS